MSATLPRQAEEREESDSACQCEPTTAAGMSRSAGTAVQRAALDAALVMAIYKTARWQAVRATAPGRPPARGSSGSAEPKPLTRPLPLLPPACARCLRATARLLLLLLLLLVLLVLLSLSCRAG